MNRTVAFLIFLSAFAIRLLVAFVIHPWFIAHGYPHWAWEWNDGYDALAKNILAGNGFSLDGIYPTASRMPLYPLFLAIILKLAGPKLYISTAVFIQALLSALTALFCYAGGTKVFNKTAGLVAGLIYSSHLSAIVYVARCTTEPLFFFLIAIASLLFIQTLEKPSAATIIGSGLCFGLSYLVRPTAIALLPFAAVFLRIFDSNKKSILQSIAAFLISLIPLTPWAIRNYSVSKAPIILSTWGGAPWFHGYYFSDNFFKTRGSRLDLDQTAMKIRENIILQRWPDVENLTGINKERFIDKTSTKLVIEKIREKPLRSMFLFARGLVLTWFANYNKSTILIGFVIFVFLFPAFVWTSFKILSAPKSNVSAKFLVALVLFFDLAHAVIYPHIRYFSAALFAVSILAALPYSNILKRLFNIQ